MESYGITNIPIAYDDHGNMPLTTPFTELQPSDITFYLEMDTRVGVSTCRQTCEHCFYIREKEAQNRVIDLTEGHRVMNVLRGRGYKVFPMISDSFARGGEFLRLFGDPKGASPVRDLHQGPERASAKTMERGEIWTSGAALLDDNWEELLILAVENGFGTITFTFHGLPDDSLKLPPREEYGISGVFYGLDGEIIIRRIHAFNRGLAIGKVGEHTFDPSVSREGLAINVGVTIGRHNRSRQNLLNYIRYFENIGVSVVRFNRYKAHGERLKQLALSEQDVRQFYLDLKWIHNNVLIKIQLAASEDFGTSGIDIMEFPAHIGSCRAGHQFFSIVADRAVLSEDAERLRERIAAISCCVEIYKPTAGQVVRVTNRMNGTTSYEVEFYPQVIEQLQRMRHDGTLKDGCWAPEYAALHRAGSLTQVRASVLSVIRPAAGHS